MHACHRSIGVIILFGAIGCAAQPRVVSQQEDKPGPVAFQAELRDELLKMMAADQELRNQLSGQNASNVRLVWKMNALDMQHTARLKEIVEDVGWPGKSIVGEDGALAAWLLVQHADLDPKFQEQCLKLMEQALREGEVAAKDVAYLTDRVRVNQGRPQVYGTQFHTVNGLLVPKPIEDPERVDERRRHVGLGTMEEYTKDMRGG